MAPLTLDLNGEIARITLDRPSAGNALDLTLVEALHDAVSAVEDSDHAAIVFQGAGKGFCGGLDLSELARETDGSMLWRLVRIERLLQRIARMRQITVAMAHGFAYGAGADLVLACRWRILSPGARLSFPGVRFGIALGTHRLALRAGAERAREILSRGEPVGAVEAVAANLASAIVAQDEWESWIAGLPTRSAIAPVLDRQIADRLHPGDDDDRDLALLVRTASEPGLRSRIENYAAGIRPARDASD